MFGTSNSQDITSSILLPQHGRCLCGLGSLICINYLKIGTFNRRANGKHETQEKYFESYQAKKAK